MTIAADLERLEDAVAQLAAVSIPDLCDAGMDRTTAHLFYDRLTRVAAELDRAMFVFWMELAR